MTTERTVNRHTWDHRLPPGTPVTTDIKQLLNATECTPFRTAAGTLVSYKASKSVIVPLLCEIGATTVCDAVDSATTHITKLGLYPSDGPLWETYRQIIRWCAAHDVTGLSEIVDDTAERLIADLADVTRLQLATTGLEFPTAPRRATAKALKEAALVAADERRRSHQVHYALVSLRSGTVLGHRRDRRHRIIRDSLAYGLPELAPVTERTGRPLTDEEILLARFLLEIDSQEGGAPRPLIGWLLAESGVRTLESTVLETRHLRGDDPERPTHIKARGVWKNRHRKAELTPYAQATLPSLLTRFRTGNQPLTYTGTKPGSKEAHASLSGVLQRHLDRAGVTDPYATAKSINLWRVLTALITDGMGQARRHHGGETGNVLTDLKLEYDEVDLKLGVVNLHHSDTGEFFTQVPKKGFYDDSVLKNRNSPHKKAKGEKKAAA